MDELRKMFGQMGAVAGEQVGGKMMINMKQAKIVKIKLAIDFPLWKEIKQAGKAAAAEEAAKAVEDIARRAAVKVCFLYEVEVEGVCSSIVVQLLKCQCCL